MRGLALRSTRWPSPTRFNNTPLNRLTSRYDLTAQRPYGLRVRHRVATVSRATADESLGQQAAHRFQEALNAVRPHTSRLTKQMAIKLKDAAVNMNDAVRRTASKADSRLRITQRTSHLATQLRIKAQSADQRFGASRRLQSWAEDFRRKWPKWSRQLRAFQSTLPGQVLTCVALFYAFSSGVAWRILHFFWIVSWIAPLLLVPVLSRLQRRAAAEQAAAARQQQQQQQQRAGQRPFVGWGPFSAARRSATGYTVQQPGPVIDAEWETIDEGDN